MSVPSTTKGYCATPNILRGSLGPSSYSEKNINTYNVISVWCLIFSDKMIRHIKQCTEAEV